MSRVVLDASALVAYGKGDVEAFMIVEMVGEENVGKVHVPATVLAEVVGSTLAHDQSALDQIVGLLTYEWVELHAVAPGLARRCAELARTLSPACAHAAAAAESLPALLVTWEPAPYEAMSKVAVHHLGVREEDIAPPVLPEDD